VLGTYVYSQDRLSKNVSELVYPVVSEHFIDSLLGHARDLNEIDQMLKNGKIKPKIYIKSNVKNITEQELAKMMDDTTEKVYEGTRLVSFSDLDDKIKEELGGMGITPDNTIFIEEGATPGDSKGMGWAGLISGALIVVFSVRSFIRKIKDE
jgi:hypothetical protein